MEIRELHLEAFGPFTDRLLEFSSPGGGLHIVYGPNEAGKSASLRGLKGFLFGIPARTTDDFLHEKRALRIAGRLLSSNGRELAVVRRKGNKNTLLSPDGGELDDAVLAPLLHGVNAEMFEMFFGIDHEALVQGGREILEQKGEVGQALFSASMGSAALHGVLEGLENEADELFKPRGSTQAINAALREYAQLQRAIKMQSLSSREWGDARRALEQTRKDLARLQGELGRCKTERNRLRRIQRALPRIVARRDCLQKLEALGTVVLLPDDFGKRREAAALELEKARAMATQATSNLSGLQVQIAAIKVSTEVLELAETIEALHARLEGHRKAIQERPHLQLLRSQLLTDGTTLLKAVRPELALADAETLRPVMTKAVRITELGNQRQLLLERVTQTGKLLRDSEKKLQKARADHQELADTGSPEALIEQVMRARKQGDLNAAVRLGREELEALEQSCQNDLSRLGALWYGTLDEIPGLPLPARASIDRFEQAYTALDQRIRRLQEKHSEYANTGRDAQQQIDEIQHAGRVPTEQQLLDARNGRDRAWWLLRRRWLDGETVDVEARELDPERALPEAFETRIYDADAIADRLRREAERVQKQASLLAALTDAGRRTEDGGRQRASCMEEHQQLDRDWAGLWEQSGILPLPPREMRAWLDNMERLQARVAELNDRRRNTLGLENTLELQRRALQQELGALGEAVPGNESLEALLVRGEAVTNRIEALVGQRQSLETEIETLEQGLETARSDVQDASNALAIWRSQWQDVVGDLGLGGDALPAEVTEMLENIRNLFVMLNEAEKLRIRIEGIDTEEGGFRDEVADVVARVAPELAKLPESEAVARLNRLLNETGKEETRRQQLEQQIQKAREDISEAEATRRTMTERLDALCQEAHCQDASYLELAERMSAEFRVLEQKIEALEQALQEIGEGMSLAELETAADGADPDRLPGEIESLTGLIDEELEPQKDQLTEAKFKQQSKLDLMDGGDAAAALADEAQSVLMGIRSKSEQYVQVKLASRILHDEIERYRRRHQGPLLKRASEHFTVLTQGSFAGLRADFNEKDEPILVGVRPDDNRVYVDGMSSGTRDQLYLALRLASLEKYMESAEPMPFIVDDILVHFDDERSKATLGVLAELAGKTQIILFTHHRRLVEQALALTTASPVRVHEL